MPELSADCLNAWVTYGRIYRTVLYVYVSTAVIPDQLDSRLATLNSSQEALYYK